MEQEQHIPIRQNQTQSENVEVNTGTEELSTKKNNIPTRLGSLIILLTATIAGAGVWWCAFSYEEPKLIDWDDVVRQMQERRVVEGEETQLPSSYEIKDGEIYHLGELIKDVDNETFEYLGGYYAKDKNNVYYSNLILENVDLKTFEYLGNSYTIDKNNVYWDREIIKNADLETFVFVGSKDLGPYAKDKNNVYWEEKKIEKADLNTFEYLGGPYAKDKNNIFYFFYNGDVIDGVDLKTFEYLGSIYAKDKNNVYIFNEVFKNVDLKTFEYLVGFYTKDKNNVYDLRKVIEGFDPQNCTLDNLETCIKLIMEQGR